MHGRPMCVGALVLALVLALAATAAAESTVGKQQRLRTEIGTRHLDHAKWAHGSDSPGDGNHRRLHALVGHDEDTTDTNYSYLAFYSRASLALNEPASSVTNLSFEFDENNHVGAGAPRISVELENGDVLYLAAFYCNHPTINPNWGRADFTAFTNNCAIWDSHGIEYPADGISTAWQVYLAAHPGVQVDQAFLVLDEEGKYNLDRVSLGADRMYISHFNRAKHCASEAAC
ncbi:MAG TPA: hypothetical protein VFI18_10870 [Gaiellales bacterium]|nr:hypothetical protein [Gaiellales bacterium]